MCVPAVTVVAPDSPWARHCVMQFIQQGVAAVRRDPWRESTPSPGIAETVFCVPVHGPGANELLMAGDIARRGGRVIVLAGSVFPDVAVESYKLGVSFCAPKSLDLTQAISFVRSLFAAPAAGTH